MSALATIELSRPARLADALAALARPGAQPLAGGTDLLPNLRRDIGEPRVLVDLSGLHELRTLRVQADGHLRIGAGVTLATLAEDTAVREGWPALAATAALVAGPTHRTAATVGGNLCQDTRCVFYNQSHWWRAGVGYCLKHRGDKCHVVVKSDRCYATYHGDIAPVLIVTGAQAEIAGPAGTRTLPVAELFNEDGARRLALRPDELLTTVTIPATGGWRSGYEKARIRDAIDFPLAGVAIALARDGARITGLRIAITGTNSAPMAVGCEAFVGATWDEGTPSALGELARKSSNVLQTTMAPVGYRRRVLTRMTQRLATELWSGGRH